MTQGAPLMPEFCSQPIAQLRTTTIDESNKRYELPASDVGLSSAIDVVLGWSWPSDMPKYQRQAGDIGEHGIMISTPVELVVLDVWIHRSLDFAMNPRVRVYSQLPSGPRYPHEGRDTGVLPLPDKVIDLGFGARAATMAEYPRHTQLLQTGMDQLGWDADDFRGYRFRLNYPPIPCVAYMQHPLLPART